MADFWKYLNPDRKELFFNHFNCDRILRDLTLKPKNWSALFLWYFMIADFSGFCDFRVRFILPSASWEYFAPRIWLLVPQECCNCTNIYSSEPGSSSVTASAAIVTHWRLERWTFSRSVFFSNSSILKSVQHGFFRDWSTSYSRTLIHSGGPHSSSPREDHSHLNFCICALASQKLCKAEISLSYWRIRPNACFGDAKIF